MMENNFKVGDIVMIDLGFADDEREFWVKCKVVGCLQGNGALYQFKMYDLEHDSKRPKPTPYIRSMIERLRLHGVFKLDEFKRVMSYCEWMLKNE